MIQLHDDKDTRMNRVLLKYDLKDLERQGHHVFFVDSGAARHSAYNDEGGTKIRAHGRGAVVSTDAGETNHRRSQAGRSLSKQNRIITQKLPLPSARPWSGTLVLVDCRSCTPSLCVRWGPRRGHDRKGVEAEVMG